jgi:hypothetical protein
MGTLIYLFLRPAASIAMSVTSIGTKGGGHGRTQTSLEQTRTIYTTGSLGLVRNEMSVVSYTSNLPT